MFSFGIRTMDIWNTKLSSHRMGVKPMEFMVVFDTIQQTACGVACCTA